MFLNNAESIGYDNRASGLEAGNVQAAIDELASGKVLISVKIAAVSSGEMSTVNVDYPEGFNKENTCAVGVVRYETYTASSSISVNHWYSPNNGEVVVHFYDDNIGIRIKGYPLGEVKVRVLLERINV